VSSNPTTSTGRTGRRIPLGSRRGRVALAGAAILVALPVLSACANGNGAEVYQIKPDSGQAKVGYLWISNVWVVADSTSGNAEVIGQIANTDPTATDTVQLTSVTVAGATATIVPPTDTTRLAPGVSADTSSVTIPGLKAVQFGQPGQPELEVSNAELELSNAALTIGANTQVVYTFSNGQTATVTAIVQPSAGLWASYNPNGANGTPTATATGTATPSVSGTATGTATASDTAKATGTATGTAKATGTATASATASSTK
jgi:hypothetical protein